MFAIFTTSIYNEIYRKDCNAPVMAFSGIVFDFDGVLFDSEKHWPAVENDYLHRHMPRWKDEYYSQLIGRSLAEIHELLSKTYGFLLTQDEYFKDYDVMAQDLYASTALPLLNVDRVIANAHGRGRSLAIASSSKRSWIDAALRRTQFAHKFSDIVTAYDSDVARSKPAPDIYLVAAKRLGLAPTQLIAIEDSKNGVLSAKAAGLYTIGIRNGFNEDQDLGSADEILLGYTGPSLQRINELLA